IGWGSDLASKVTGKEPDLTPELVRQLSFGAWADVSKAVEQLGYEVVPLPAMVKEAVDWMRAEELIPAHSD
ncbi:MAG: oxidoreductase, partial [Actinobacteria bacterium]|nr:oxidoreductase [Actinomycetota bacterium]